MRHINETTDLQTNNNKLKEDNNTVKEKNTKELILHSGKEEIPGTKQEAQKNNHSTKPKYPLGGNALFKK